MKEVYESYNLKELRKIVADHNRRERKGIMEEVKKMRIEAKAEIRKKKEKLISERTITTMKLKKEQIINKILNNQYINNKFRKFLKKRVQTKEEDEQDLLDFLQQDLDAIVKQYKKDDDKDKLKRNIKSLHDKAKKLKLKQLGSVEQQVKEIIDNVEKDKIVKKIGSIFKKIKFTQEQTEKEKKKEKEEKVKKEEEKKEEKVKIPSIKVSDFDVDEKKKKLLILLENKKEIRNKLRKNSKQKTDMEEVYLSTFNMKQQRGLGGKNKQTGEKNPNNENARLIEMVKKAETLEELKIIEKYIKALVRFHYDRTDKKPIFDRFFNPEKYEKGGEFFA